MMSNEVTIKVIEALEDCGIAYMIYIESVREPSTGSH